MKVLMLTTSFPLFPGDPAGTFVYEQARHLNRAGVSVEILAPLQDNASRFEIMDGVPVRRFPYFWPENQSRLCYGYGIPENMKADPSLRFQLPFLTGLFFIHALKLARGRDVLYAHWSLAGLAAVLAGKLTGKPAVVMIHHGQERYGDSRLEKFVINYADRVVCNSGYTMSRLTRFYHPRHCDILPPGVDVDIFRPQPIDSSDIFYANLGIPEHMPVVLAMGRHIEWKGYIHLVEAAARLKDRSSFVLVVGGQGPETDNLKKRAADLGIRERVILPGHIPNRDMPRLYNRASVFVQPSVIDGGGHTEGLGVVLMEAMACGIPCVASDVGGIPDLVRDGHNGILVPAGDVPVLAESIFSLLKDPATGRKMGENGRRFIEQNYSWTALTGKTIALLESLRPGAG
ncbi:MAG: glycosyltransferase family 4 protein [Thermodesulfobacteriota bacterium]